MNQVQRQQLVDLARERFSRPYMIVSKCGKYVFEIERDRDEQVFIRFVSRDYDWIARDRNDKVISLEDIKPQGTLFQ